MLDQLKLSIDVVKANTLNEIRKRIAYDVKNLLELDGYKCKIVGKGRKMRIIPEENLSDEELETFNKRKQEYTEDLIEREKERLINLRKSILGR